MDDNTTLLSPTYTIHRYTDQIYKIVKFKHEFIKLPSSTRDTSSFNHYDKKLDPSLSRTRKLLLEKALCNKWEWFGTFTIDGSKYDRYDLGSWYKAFSQFIRDERKKCTYLNYLLVPEKHDNDAWHCHGFLSGDIQVTSFDDLFRSGVKLPLYLIGRDFYRWDNYHSKFGFCSLGRIKSPVRSAFYITKYITKDTSRLVSDVGSKLFYCSQGLSKALKDGDIFGSSSYLDDFLTADYEFCKVGMTKVSDNIKWHTLQDLYDIPVDALEPLFDDGSNPLSADMDPVKDFDMDMFRINFEQCSFEL